MENIIKVLHLEDSLKDFELIHSIIEGGGIAHEYFLADNEKDFINILETEKIDIILSDNHLPDYNGNEALKLVRENYPYTPFLFVTGTMGEDAAIESMVNGATDYVLKDKLERLVPAIKRALHENELEINRKRTEKTFLQSEENYHRSISESPLGIRIISIEGETIYVNKAFLDIYEYNSLEEFRCIPAINRHTPESYVQHQIRKEKRKNGHDIFDYEVSIIRKNAEIRYIKVWRKEVLWDGVKHYQTFNLDITEQKQSEEALNNSQQELRKFATHLQHVREEEKIALAREIHDDLGQILVALKIDLGMFEKKLSKGIEATTSEELLSKLNDLTGLVEKTIKSARRIMNGLRPELIELLGFEEACKSYLRDFEETHHINSRFESAIMNLNIDLEQSVALFRILQEALNNIIKHAKATLVTVQLSNPAGKLVLKVFDNGVGFDENNKGRQDSYGLIGMKERVFLLDGNLDITSKVGKGTSVKVEIPYQTI